MGLWHVVYQSPESWKREATSGGEAHTCLTPLLLDVSST